MNFQEYDPRDPGTTRVDSHALPTVADSAGSASGTKAPSASASSRRDWLKRFGGLVGSIAGGSALLGGATGWGITRWNAQSDPAALGLASLSTVEHSSQQAATHAISAVENELRTGLVHSDNPKGMDLGCDLQTAVNHSTANQEAIAAIVQPLARSNGGGDPIGTYISALYSAIAITSELNAVPPNLQALLDLLQTWQSQVKQGFDLASFQGSTQPLGHQYLRRLQINLANTPATLGPQSHS